MSRKKSKVIRLSLPDSVSPNQSFYGVRIVNNNFENIGLKRGGLALAVRSEIKQGDLVAFSLNGSNEVVIGFYSILFGIISLQDCHSNVEIYNQNEVEYFGKIIGYGNDITKRSIVIEIIPIPVIVVN